MRKILNTFFFLFAAAVVSFAQDKSDGANAISAVNKLFSEMANHNPEAIRSIYTPEAQLAALVKQKDGKTATHYYSAEGFSKLFAVKRGELKEDMYKAEVRVYGDLAMVWGRYVFFVDGKITHCGLNSFHLVRLDSGWKIANAASTIEPQGCTDKEKKRKIEAK